MIVGVGTDIVEVERIRRAVEDPRTGERFKRRVYTSGEIQYCMKRRNSSESFAVRFAAKESVMKALGVGFGDGIGWREIEIVREDGRPRIELHGKAHNRAAELGVTEWHLALSHSGENAVAFVIAEREVIRNQGSK